MECFLGARITVQKHSFTTDLGETGSYFLNIFSCFPLSLLTSGCSAFNSGWIGLLASNR